MTRLPTELRVSRPPGCIKLIHLGSKGFTKEEFIELVTQVRNVLLSGVYACIANQLKLVNVVGLN